MKSSDIALICIVIFSFFAMHECERLEAIEKENSSKIYVPPCYKTICSFTLKKDCWCCFEPVVHKDLCWGVQDYPNAKELCFDECSKNI
ncbi:unnamed protein product [Arabidopsis halleri]